MAKKSNGDTGTMISDLVRATKDGFERTNASIDRGFARTSASLDRLAISVDHLVRTVDRTSEHVDKLVQESKKNSLKLDTVSAKITRNR